MVAAAGTCTPWAEIGDLCSPCDDYSTDAAIMSDALQVASDILFELTGRRWSGECEETVRPQQCPTERCLWASAEPSSVGWARRWGCHSTRSVRLPSYPVVAISEVLLDGDVVSASDYRLDERRLLVSVDEDVRWPCCQNVNDPTTEDDTFSVTYTYGYDPPLGGVKAAATLACQLYLACNPEEAGGECRLPQRVQTITREGITMAVLDPFTVFTDGMTGLAEVDLWINSVRYGAKNRRAKVFVPGRDSTRRVV